MILIDVRIKGEYGGGHIDGAINHDIMDMMQGVFPDIGKEELVRLAELIHTGLNLDHYSRSDFIIHHKN